MNCSFCNKPRETARMITGQHGAHICEGCVLSSLRVLGDQPEAAKPTIYISSRVWHAPRWRALRELGVPITASWIDHTAVPEDFAHFWATCIEEIRQCSVLLLYAQGEADFPFKGALIETGVAIAYGKRVIVALEDVALDGPTMRPIGSWIMHPHVTVVQSLETALALCDRKGEEKP